MRDEEGRTARWRKPEGWNGIACELGSENVIVEKIDLLP